MKTKVIAIPVALFDGEVELRETIETMLLADLLPECKICGDQPFIIYSRLETGQKVFFNT